MTTSENLIAAAPTLAQRLREHAGRASARLAFSEMTPTALALVGVLFVAGAAGAVVIAQRLEEIAADRVQARLIANTAPAPVIREQVLDFTLAPDEVRAIDADAARAFNAAIPFSTLPILAARPFIMAPDRIEEYARALDCLTAAVYFEAGAETTEGQAAVAQVVLNRMRHPAYPRTVCGVVFQGSERATGCQFSFTCDGAMDRPRSIEGWARARASAAAALNGSVAAGVGMATHYHTDWVAPYWAERLVKMRQIGTHIFYRWAGTWGLPGAFAGRHSGSEPIIDQMAALAEPIVAVDLIETPVIAQTPEPILLIVPPPARPAREGLEARALNPTPVEVAAAPTPPAPQPTVMVNPMVAATAAPPPRRRSRIAAPSW